MYEYEYEYEYEYMRRMEWISENDCEWGSKIIDFMSENDEFKKYGYMIPLLRREAVPYKNVNNLFEGLMFYVCGAGVRMQYATSQWEIIYPIVQSNDVKSIMEKIEENTKIQKKKKETYLCILRFMEKNNIERENISLENIKKMREEVKGVGEGCVGWCVKYYSLDDDCVECSDRYFVKGYKILYGNMSNMRKRVNIWKEKGYGRIANLMVMAVSYLDK